MEMGISGSGQVRDRAFAQRRLHERPGDWLGHCDKTACRFRRTVRRRALTQERRSRLWLWHAEEGPGLVGDVLEIYKAAAFAYHVEQIAMFARGGVGPLARGTLGRILQPHIHRAARRVAYVADEPVAEIGRAHV